MTVRAPIEASRDLCIRQETSPIILQEVFRLRAAVWRKLLNDSEFPNDEWTDQFDEHALHWVAHVDGRLAGAARMNIQNTLEAIPDVHVFAGLEISAAAPIASISRLVVHPDFRGLGISSRLDSLRLTAARELNCRSMTAIASEHSGLERLLALQKLGFVAVVPPYSVRDIDGDFVTPMVLSL